MTGQTVDCERCVPEYLCDMCAGITLCEAMGHDWDDNPDDPSERIFCGRCEELHPDPYMTGGVVAERGIFL